jgi:hypothetical protein
MNVTEFKTRYITFNDIEDEIVESELLLNESLLNPRLWINEIQRNTAQGLLTAHFLELERMSNLTLGGALRAIEEGSSIDLKLLDRTTDYYRMTVYGQRYLQLKNTITGSSIFVT